MSEQTHAEFVAQLHDPGRRLSRLLEEVGRAVKQRGVYSLCLGSTEISDMDGISGAGADAKSRRETPAIDAEALVAGRPLTAKEIPVSPAGIVSPVVISAAMVNLVDCRIDVFDCGAFVPPKVEAQRIGRHPAARPDTGAALDIKEVEKLFDYGREAGRTLAQRGQYLVIGECVPGGTTTAMGVLAALGYSPARLVSSSMPAADNDKRFAIVQEGIQKSGLTVERATKTPLLAVAAVGDPMQPFVAGLALDAATRIPVVLGGGTQMLTVYALMRAIAGDAELKERLLGVITTKWVAYDTAAGATKLAELVNAPFAASCPDFHRSRHKGLQAYEQGNVKEGVAAGAMMALASLCGYGSDRIVESIDLQYDRMVLSLR